MTKAPHSSGVCAAKSIDKQRRIHGALSVWDFATLCSLLILTNKLGRDVDVIACPPVHHTHGGTWHGNTSRITSFCRGNNVALALRKVSFYPEQAVEQTVKLFETSWRSCDNIIMLLTTALCLYFDFICPSSARNRLTITMDTTAFEYHNLYLFHKAQVCGNWYITLDAVRNESLLPLVTMIQNIHSGVQTVGWLLPLGFARIRINQLIGTENWELAHQCRINFEM